MTFQCSSASRKFLNLDPQRRLNSPLAVSVLFSEPKIPQYRGSAPLSRARHRFSALQRAENSSIDAQAVAELMLTVVSVLFSEPKIPQFSAVAVGAAGRCGFSALQRAENSSILPPRLPSCLTARFQCSSASRKFLNREDDRRAARRRSFQCSSASRKFLNV